MTAFKLHCASSRTISEEPGNNFIRLAIFKTDLNFSVTQTIKAFKVSTSFIGNRRNIISWSRVAFSFDGCPQCC